MSEEESIVLSFAQDSAKSLAKRIKGKLLSKEDGLSFYLLPTVPQRPLSTKYKLEEKLKQGRTVDRSKKFVYSNFTMMADKRVIVSNLDKKELKETNIKILYFDGEFRTIEEVGPVWIDYELAIIHKRGRPAVIKKDIKEFIGTDTFDTFGGLYNFSKL